MKTEKQLKQKNEKHFSKKKSKKNADPGSDDHLNQIPHRLREIMKSKERMKQGFKKKKKDSKPKMLSGDIPVPHFRRRQRESEKAYVRRMTEEAEHVLFLTNNQVERHPEVELKKEEEPTGEKKPAKKKWDKFKLQQQKKKLNQQAERDEEEMFKDEVQFGEVAMAPPSLSVKPKKATVKPQGASKGLLLNSLLGHSSVSVNKPSMARKRIMEEERERVVQLYRQMKQQKQRHKPDSSATNST
ncbi:coiled-coil domain-containing protein 137 [Danio rerio]|uniref:Coiled-coil domain-containing protein 137 n=1 Tax=Danio rerio TaxID=7955 RepID=Q08C68_DANRE|nr:coiled-coil domain-containing protein 137 [Danio rerio]AAI24365.1 Zgc:153477 [Danio rerio]|eukprot:NP_001070224.1 coiled-coil domain-containing protein 137 [Danio rerio]